MPDYEVEVVSVDTGDKIETTVDTPVADPQPKVEETVEETVETTEKPAETKADDNLVELPDGRKLPPKEAEVEYRNLYSEFTRKSQKLATYEKDPSKITNNKPTEDKEFVPQTWEEVEERGALRALKMLEEKEQAERNIRQQTEEYVSTQISELKKENPTLNETQLYNHAIKYGFQDLKVAYSNMKDMHASIKKATETTVQNIQKRNAEPISGGGQGGAIIDGDVYDPSVRNISMADYLRSMK